MWQSYIIFLVVLSSLLLASTEGQSAKKKTSFEDARCKCVCPKFKKDENSSVSEKTIFISSNVDPNKCVCDFVVDMAYRDVCSRCQCKYESRNTTTIKVFVIIIICVLALLLVYMLFLLCLDPLIARRPGQYQEHTNEEDDQTVTQVPQFEAGARPRMSRQKSVINYMTDEQKRWKSTVQEQRKNIYDKHTMLN